MVADTLRDTIVAHAAEIRRLHDRVHATLRYRYKSPEETKRWETACREFNSRYDKLAFPGGATTAKSRIAAGDAEAIEVALCFVECRPHFFRSGYMFKDFLPKLKNAELMPSQRERLDKVLSAYDAWRAAKRAARSAQLSADRP